MAVSPSAEPLRGYRQYYYKKIIGVFALVALSTLLAFAGWWLAGLGVEGAVIRAVAVLVIAKDLLCLKDSLKAFLL